MTKETKILLAIVGFVVVGMIGLFMLNNKPATTSSATVDSSKLVHDDSHKHGDGAVTLVEFGDYQCPVCGAAYPILKKVEADYAGKITFVFRNYPLPMHPNAPAAAEAAEAANSQGKFWEMHDLLYEKQTEWSALSNPIDKFTEYAQSLGLDTTKFKADVSSNAYQSVISQDQSDGNALNVQGTPTLYVNGQVLADYQYATIKSALDSAIGK